MRETDILDSEIPGADPAAVVQQYEPLIFKIANRYMFILEKSGAVSLEDLHQAGRIAILQAQKRYDPTGGASFLTFVYEPIRWAVRRAAGFNPNTGKAPEQLVYLDEPLPGLSNEELTRLDVLQDPDAVPLDEPIIEDETRRETSEQVRAAVQRLKNERQRDYISRIFLQGETVSSIAAKEKKTTSYINNTKNVGLRNLRQDYHLREYRPRFSTSLQSFRYTFTSQEEAYILWLESQETKFRNEMNKKTGIIRDSNGANI